MIGWNVIGGNVIGWVLIAGTVIGWVLIAGIVIGCVVIVGIVIGWAVIKKRSKFRFGSGSAKIPGSVVSQLLLVFIVTG